MQSTLTAAYRTGSEQPFESDRDVYSPTFCSVFLEGITTDTLEDHKSTFSIGGRTVIDFCFAGNIDGLAGEEEELAALVQRLDKAATAYSMEVSAEKTKSITNNTSGIKTDIKVNG